MQQTRSTSCGYRRQIGWSSSTATQDGQWSIRVNDQRRICFRWEDRDAYDVEVTDYH